MWLLFVALFWTGPLGPLVGASSSSGTSPSESFPVAMPSPGMSLQMQRPDLRRRSPRPQRSENPAAFRWKGDVGVKSFPRLLADFEPQKALS